MNLNEYQSLAGVTDAPSTNANTGVASIENDKLLLLLLNLVSTTEESDAIKRRLFYGDTKTFERMVESAKVNETIQAALEKGGYILTPEDYDVIHAAIGLNTESGEILKEFLLAKVEGRAIDMSNMVEEGGDAMWYVAKLARFAGTSIEEFCVKNIAKLKKRYGDKFSAHAALNRDLEAEKTALNQ